MFYIKEVLQNKMYYRDSSLDDIDGEYVYPKPFKSNSDSSIPPGKWSFWFDKPISITDWATKVIIGSKFKPELEGKMYFSQKWGYYKDNYSIKEYVTSVPVRIESMLISKFVEFIESEERRWEQDGTGWFTESYPYAYCPVTHKLNSYGDIRIIDPKNDKEFKQAKEMDLIYYTLSEEVFKLFDCKIIDVYDYNISKQANLDRTEKTPDYY